MNNVTISYNATKRIGPICIRRLFRRGGFNDWFTSADTIWYLKHALFVASAWSGQKCVGIAVLTGDGQINASLDLLLVDQAFRGQGIGSKLMALVVERLQRLKPYHVSVEVFERRTERFYARFDFVRNKGTWLLDYAPTSQRLRRKVKASRQRRKQEEL